MTSLVHNFPDAADPILLFSSVTVIHVVFIFFFIVPCS